LASAHPAARVISLEGCPELSRLARLNLGGLGIRNAEVITGPFSETLPRAVAAAGKVGLVYIDGNHRGSALIEYFNLCLEHADNDTIIVIDDIRSSPDMEQAWEQIRNHSTVRVSLDLYFSGWLFFRSELSREHFKLRYF
jgi:predicted O-methyltransferase YrrM